MPSAYSNRKNNSEKSGNRCTVSSAPLAADTSGPLAVLPVEEDSLVNTAQVQRMSIEEAERCVKDMCHIVARYCYLAPAIATNKDSARLRDDLLHLRANAYELARVNKAYLLPRLRHHQQLGTNLRPGEVACPTSHPPSTPSSVTRRVEAIFYTFCACLECLFEHLIRTYDAVASASRQGAAIDVAKGGTTDRKRGDGGRTCRFANSSFATLGITQVNTGLTEQVTVAALNRVNGVTMPVHLLNTSYSNSQRGSRRSSAAPNQQQSSGEAGQYHAKALEEMRGLGCDLQALRDMIFEIHSSISINPWAICPDLDLAKLDETGSLTSLDSGDSAPSNHLVENEHRGNSDNSGGLHGGSTGQSTRATIIRTKHQRCLCLLLVILTSVVLFAVVLGVCINMLA